MTVLDHPALVALSVAPAAAILAYYLYVARSAPEPWIRVLACCLAGAGAYALSAALQPELRALVPRWPRWIWALGVVAPLEELAKLGAMLAGSPRVSRYERVSSGLVYGVAAGVGFACAENVRYVLDFGATTGVLRAVTAVPAHALHAALMGIGLGLVHRTERPVRRVAVVAGGLAAATAFHGAYDAVLVGAGAARVLVVALLAAEIAFVGWAVRFLLERDVRRDMERLRAVPIFRDLPASCVRILASGATRQRLPAHRTVVHQGRRGSDLYFVLRGQLTVRIDGAEVSRLGPGQFFGEQSVLTGGLRSADVITNTSVLVSRVSRSLLLRAVASHPRLAEGLTREAEPRFESGTLPRGDAVVEAAHTLEQSASMGLDILAVRLSRAPFFVGLRSDDLESLADACVSVKRASGSRLVRKGGDGAGLCLLLSGRASVRLPSGEVSLGPGEVFGEIALLTGWPATATVTASEPVRLAILAWPDLAAVLARNPELGALLLEISAARTRGRSEAPTRRPLLDYFHALLAVGARWLMPLEADAARLHAAYPDLRTLPPGVAEALARTSTPVATGEPIDGLFLGTDGGVRGAIGALQPAVESTARADGPGWLLSRDGLLDAVADCPDVVRFLARRLAIAKRR